jgi:glucose/arabinose dehydrogenase
MAASIRTFTLALLTISLVACGATARLPVTTGIGPNPTLPPPSTSPIPLVKVATAKGWAPGEKPISASGTVVSAFASGLEHPRWLYILPNGDVLVAETNAPARPDDNKGLKGWFFKRYQTKAGGAAPSANRITLLRDADGDGVAETRSPFLTGLNSPFGMVLVDQTLYVANTDALVAFPYREGDLRIDAQGTTLADLPGGTLNHHWTKNVVASPDGRTLYVSVGSNSNVAENGIEQEKDRAAILAIDRTTGGSRVFASGLRNPVGMAWEPERGALWTAVNERDELGSDLVPDYMTSVREGGFYGWPYSYFGQHVDKRVKPQRPDLVAQALEPDYALGAHTASLGLGYSTGGVAGRFGRGMFVGQHGSWNRQPRSGYKVIFVPFTNGMPSGEPVDVLTGFLDERDGDSRGRPVGVVIDRQRALLVADDVGNVIWRVSAATASESSTSGSE